MSQSEAASISSHGGTALSQKQIGLVLIGLAVLMMLFRSVLPAGVVVVPEWLTLPLSDWFNQVFNFIKDDLGLIHVTRFFAGGVEWLLDVTANILYGKNRWPRLDPIPWTVVAVSAFMVGYALKGWWLGIISGGTFVWLAMLGQWKWAMETLSVIIVAAPLAVASGLILGVAAWRSRWFELLLNPFLNLAQSLPHFTYMIPVVVFIGVGPKAGAIATIIFATPPMVRMTVLGLKKGPAEVVESGMMSGATRWQLLTQVRLPTARAEILVGVNQVIMQCLAMVVLASFIGMPGLGYKLLQLMNSLKIGRSIEIGISIVLIAVVLDRCSKAWVDLQPTHWERGTPWWRRNALLLIWMGLVAALFAAVQVFDYAYEIPRRQAFTASKDLDWAVGLFLTAVEDYTLAFRAFMIEYVLIPMRDAYRAVPWFAVIALFAGIGWRVGGPRSASIAAGYMFFIALSGWWDRAMITAYLVSFAVMLVMVIGLPLGVWAARSEGRAKAILLALDTAQTFPSFVYLVPVIMLFQVSDVAVIAAVMVFGLVPLTRYTIEGLRGVPPALMEAADMSGATRRQKVLNVQLPLALPTIMVGVNQAILFSLFMVVIAAFIGTIDLGQEMQRALSANDFGKGLTLGLCVAFFGLMADHLLMRWSEDRRRALGLVK